MTASAGIPTVCRRVTQSGVSPPKAIESDFTTCPAAFLMLKMMRASYQSCSPLTSPETRAFSETASLSYPPEMSCLR